jgi:hypothetical protein
MLAFLRHLAVPAVLSLALFVFFRLVKLIQPALVADLQPSITAKRSWRHFRLVIAYITMALVIASLVLIAGIVLSRSLPSRDTAPRASPTEFVRASAMELRQASACSIPEKKTRRVPGRSPLRSREYRKMTAGGLVLAACGSHALSTCASRSPTSYYRRLDEGHVRVTPSRV